MSKTIVALFTATLLCAGSLGCQTAAKMAWWKTGDNANVESTALAHSAPALPADVAKQAENLAKAAPSIQMSGGQAAPYSTPPSYTPAAGAVNAAPGSVAATDAGAKVADVAAFPSTGASPYSTQVAPSTPSVSPAYVSADQAADLGAVDMPYNPNAVPPARSVAVTPVSSPAATADRYGLARSASTYGGGGTPLTTGATTPTKPQSAAKTLATRPLTTNSLVAGAGTTRTAPTVTAAVPQVDTQDRYADIPTTPTPTNSMPSKVVSTVPPASSSIATTATTSPNLSSESPVTAPAYPVAGSRYPSMVASAPTTALTAATTTAASGASIDRAGPPAGSPPLTANVSTGARYATNENVSSPTASTTAPNGTTTAGGQAVASAATASPSPPAGSIATNGPQTATPGVVAVSQATPAPYRPGGTESYRGIAGSGAAVEIASRPSKVQHQVPNLTAPPIPATEPAQASRYR